MIDRSVQSSIDGAIQRAVDGGSAGPVPPTMFSPVDGAGDPTARTVAVGIVSPRIWNSTCAIFPRSLTHSFISERRKLYAAGGTSGSGQEIVEIDPVTGNRDHYMTSNIDAETRGVARVRNMSDDNTFQLVKHYRTKFGSGGVEWELQTQTASEEWTGDYQGYNPAEPGSGYLLHAISPINENDFVGACYFSSVASQSKLKKFTQATSGFTSLFSPDLGGRPRDISYDYVSEYVYSYLTDRTVVVTPKSMDTVEQVAGLSSLLGSFNAEGIACIAGAGGVHFLVCAATVGSVHGIKVFKLTNYKTATDFDFYPSSVLTPDGNTPVTAMDCIWNDENTKSSGIVLGMNGGNIYGFTLYHG